MKNGVNLAKISSEIIVIEKNSKVNLNFEVIVFVSVNNCFNKKQGIL